MTTIAQNEEILKQLEELLEAHRPAVGQQRILERMKALVFGEMLALGRHTLTQVLMALGLTEADWTAWYRLFSEARFEEEAVNGVLLGECLKHIGAEEVLVLGGDGTQTPRTSAKMEGVGYLLNPRTPPFNRGIHLAQRWFHGALFLPAEQGYSRAVPLRFMPAFTPKAVRTITQARSECEAAQDYLKWIQTHLQSMGRGEQAILFVADGGYDTLPFWQGLPPGVTALIRTAKNRALHYLPPSPTHGNRKYGDKAPTPQDVWRERRGWKFCTLTLRGRQRRLRYRIQGPCLRYGNPNTPLFLVVVGGEAYHRHGQEKHRDPVAYLVNAVQDDTGHWGLPCPPQVLLFWAWQRWELEVVHREMKSNLGLGEKQAWHPQAALSSVAWSAWVYALLILAAYRAWGLTGGPRTRTAWWQGGRRWSFNTLLRQCRAAVGGGHTFHASWYTLPGNCPEKIPPWLDLHNTLYGAARL